ncbi:hypothetical protein OJF2_41080 [Aquisphaera giovannonii]|uniref:Uncharacterized protein n=2 Tax=Aquisphaera giovannonii TaxID=406548 RepID=A0A5B9W606_9BACT|nr:hypothetical protein OJF2_41080 [Aquisphaera giovannonii]
MSPLGRSRPGGSRPFCLVTLVAWLCFPVGSRAEVKETNIESLATNSELIVVAKVTKIEDAPASLERDDPSMPPLKVATARVLETWKGGPVREVRYIASPDWTCDTSHADEGERVVLFLSYEHWRKDRTFFSITHAGRGRMPIREVEGKRYAAVQDDVILPAGTPTISEQKTTRITLPASEQDRPSIVVTHPVRSIEVGRLRGLTKQTPSVK